MPQQSIRRQARFLSDRVILPQGVDHARWYDVWIGRRCDDARPGMVLLDLGTHRLHVPADCLEFRMDRPATVRRWRGRKVVLAASLVPLSLAAMVAVAMGAMSVDGG